MVSRSFLARFLALAVLDEFDADHQAFAAHNADGAVARLDLGQGIERVLAEFGGVLHQPVLDQIQRGQAGSAGQRIAAEGVAVRAGGPVHDAGAGDGGAERHARGDALGRADDIGFDAPVLDRPPLARSADAGSGPRRRSAGCRTCHTAGAAPERSRGAGSDVAAFALDRLDHDGGAVIGRDGAGRRPPRCSGRRPRRSPHVGREDRAIRIGEGDMEDALHHRAGSRAGRWSWRP